MLQRRAGLGFTLFIRSRTRNASFHQHPFPMHSIPNRSFERLGSLQVLWHAYHACRQGKRRQPRMAAFDIYADRHLCALQRALISRRYTPVRVLRQAASCAAQCERACGRLRTKARITWCGVCTRTEVCCHFERQLSVS